MLLWWVLLALLYYHTLLRVSSQYKALLIHFTNSFILVFLYILFIMGLFKCILIHIKFGNVIILKPLYYCTKSINAKRTESSIILRIGTISLFRNVFCWSRRISNINRKALTSTIIDINTQKYIEQKQIMYKAFTKRKEWSIDISLND